MRPNRLALALAMAMFALPMSALAQDNSGAADPEAEAATAEAAAQDEAPAEAAAEEEEEESNWTWNLALTSDYLFRGISQTDRKPAVQGGLDYAFGDSGFYVGIWASNVDFADADGPDMEVDTYVGWNHDLSDAWNLDLSVVHYGYFGERQVYGNIDYSEAIGALTWSEMLTFTVAYAPDYSNLGYNSLYFNVTGSWEIGEAFSLNAGFGHSVFGEDNGNYNDWNVGISRQFGPVNAALNYYDTDIDDAGDRLSDAVVLSLTFGDG